MTDTRDLVVIRHGHAHCNETGTITGPACTGLTDIGRAQATATARRFLDDADVTAIHTSTTPRARETAKLIACVLGLAATDENNLRVPDPGAAEGQQWETARAKWPHDPNNPTRPAAPDAEAWNAYLNRATTTVTRMLDGHPSGTLLVVGHSETLTAVFHLLLNVPTLGRLKLAFDHCAVTRWQTTIEWPGTRSPYQRWSLLQHNDVRHLTGPAML
jgi:2,3-bisphosphoglycerate-dependent phosphoglycerate mutase